MFPSSPSGFPLFLLRASAEAPARTGSGRSPPASTRWRWGDAALLLERRGPENNYVEHVGDEENWCNTENCRFLVCLHDCLFVCLFGCLFACLLAYLLDCLFVCLLVGSLACLLACIIVCLSVCLSVCLFVCLFACLLACLFVCLFVGWLVDWLVGK